MTRHAKKLTAQQIEEIKRMSKPEIIKFLKANYGHRPNGRPPSIHTKHNGSARKRAMERTVQPEPTIRAEARAI